LERGKFEEWPESRDAKRLMLSMSSPVAGFIDDCCSFAPGLRIEKQTLYRAFVEFSQGRGIDPVTDNVFSTKLREAVNAKGRRIDDYRPRDGGARLPQWRGLTLNSESWDHYYQHDAGLLEIVGGAPGWETVLRDGRGRPILNGADDESDFDD
jgi:hypothetical protein